VTYISIVIPIYNENSKIGKDIDAASKYLERINRQSEIIIVDDGSATDITDIISSSRLPDFIKLRYLRDPVHRGKGYAVSCGIRESLGNIVMFVDSGNCVSYNFVDTGIKIIDSNDISIAHGSRKMSGSKIIQPPSNLRRIYQKLFPIIFRMFYNIPSNFTDTQCGFKIYKGNVARSLYENTRSNGFLFEIEIINKAMKAGYKIREFPIEWKADLDSRISPLKDSLKIIGELLKLFFILKKEKY